MIWEILKVIGSIVLFLIGISAVFLALCALAACMLSSQLSQMEEVQRRGEREIRDLHHPEGRDG